METQARNRLVTALVVVFCIGLFACAYLIYERSTLLRELELQRTTLNESQTELEVLRTSLLEIQQAYSLSEENGSELLRQLTDEKDRNDEFEDQIDDLSGTVGILDKLAKTDPKLLQKYSKVYFLNEHYAPEKVVEVKSNYLFRPERQEYILSQVSSRLTDLLNDARDDGIDISILSAYRSFDTQANLKSGYTSVFGTGANAFSADQGYSEHQLGTTVDFTTSGIGAGLSGFENTEAYAWLQKKAHRYGFVLSYPNNNAYYIFEPWHWRFVGEDLADDLYDDGKYFYDLDQRKIDTYLISIFD